MAPESVEAIASGSIGSRPGLLLRARVRLALSELDTRLARGEDSTSDPRLALRSAQLASRHSRKRLAIAIERVCERSRDDRAAISAAVPVDADGVDLARAALAQLGAALRSLDAVQPRGVALTRRLLTEPASALFNPKSPEALYEAAREALLALTARGRDQ